MNIPIPTKIDGAPTPKCDPIGFDPQPNGLQVDRLPLELLRPRAPPARSARAGRPAPPCQSRSRCRPRGTRRRPASSARRSGDAPLPPTLGRSQTTRPRLARKHNFASEVGPTLQDAFFFPPRSVCEASARQRQARCSAQTGRCKLVCASCSTQVAPCKLVPASGSLQVALCKLLRASCSLQVALCKLLCASCSVQVVLRKLLCASCSRQGALRKLVGASWSAQVNLLCARSSAQVALKCKLHLATPAREPGRNRTCDPPVPRTTRQIPRTSSNNKSCKKPGVFAPRLRRGLREHRRNRKKTSSFCTSTTPIPAEGRAGTLEIAKNLEFLHLDHADPRRGSREHRRNRKKKPRVFAPRPRRSPQRVARACLKAQKRTRVFAPRPRRSPQRVDFRVMSSALPRRPKKRF